MIRIKCINPNCSSPTKSFEWDETTELEEGGSLAKPGEEDAVRVLVTCPYCGTDNVVWVKGVLLDDIVEEEEE
jgi:hypothetical protein